MISAKRIAIFLCLIFFMFNCQKDPADPGKSTPKPTPIPTKLDTNLFALQTQFSKIPAGGFKMGSSDTSHHKHTWPVHNVDITKAFYMGKYEVTQEQWEAVMGAHKNHSGNQSSKKNPVEDVYWGEVQDFIQKLNQAYGQNIFRLPTESEWEYACRAGTIGNYGGNGILDQMGWYQGNSGSPRTTHEVGLKQPNDWGLYDMHGNVEEWCYDWFGRYDMKSQVDPQGPKSGEDRVTRGGSYNDQKYFCESSNRGHHPPQYHQPTLGFRLVRIK